MLYIFSLWDFQLMVKLSCRYCKSYGNVNNWLCDWTNLSRFGGSLPSLNVYIGLVEYTLVKLKYSQLCMCAEILWLFLSTTTIIHTSFQFALRANLAYQIRHKVGLIARKKKTLGWILEGKYQSIICRFLASTLEWPCPHVHIPPSLLM